MNRTTKDAFVKSLTLLVPDVLSKNYFSWSEVQSALSRLLDYDYGNDKKGAKTLLNDIENGLKTGKYVLHASNVPQVLADRLWHDNKIQGAIACFENTFYVHMAESECSYYELFLFQNTGIYKYVESLAESGSEAALDVLNVFFKVHYFPVWRVFIPTLTEKYYSVSEIADILSAELHIDYKENREELCNLFALTSSVFRGDFEYHLEKVTKWNRIMYDRLCGCGFRLGDCFDHLFKRNLSENKYSYCQFRYVDALNDIQNLPVYCFLDSLAACDDAEDATEYSNAVCARKILKKFYDRNVREIVTRILPQAPSDQYLSRTEMTKIMSREYEMDMQRKQGKVDALLGLAYYELHGEHSINGCKKEIGCDDIPELPLKGIRNIWHTDSELFAFFKLFTEAGATNTDYWFDRTDYYNKVKMSQLYRVLSLSRDLDIGKKKYLFELGILENKH